MNPTRRQKNQALASANLLLAPIMLFKVFWMEQPIGLAMTVWLIALVPVLVALWMTPRTHRRIRWIHTSLFLLSGTAIGMTLGFLIKTLLHASTAHPDAANPVASHWYLRSGVALLAK